MPSLIVCSAVTCVRTIRQFCGVTPGGQDGATSLEVVVPSSMTAADADDGTSTAKSPPTAAAAIRELFISLIEHEPAAAVAHHDCGSRMRPALAAIASARCANVAGIAGAGAEASGARSRRRNV